VKHFALNPTSAQKREAFLGALSKISKPSALNRRSVQNLEAFGLKSALCAKSRSLRP